jgi:hypothetical protein
MPKRRVQKSSASRQKQARQAEERGPFRSKAKNGTVTISLRVPSAMLEKIDEAVRRRPYPMPRHMWLLEAVHEKLMRLREPEERAGGFRSQPASGENSGR